MIKQHYRHLVEKENPFKSNEEKYLGSYQKAVTAVIKKMSDEELEEVEDILEMWNKDGGPSDVQLK